MSRGRHLWCSGAAMTTGTESKQNTEVGRLIQLGHHVAAWLSRGLSADHCLGVANGTEARSWRCAAPACCPATV